MSVSILLHHTQLLFIIKSPYQSSQYKPSSTGFMQQSTVTSSGKFRYYCLLFCVHILVIRISRDCPPSFLFTNLLLQYTWYFAMRKFYTSYWVFRYGKAPYSTGGHAEQVFFLQKTFSSNLSSRIIYKLSSSLHYGA